MANIASAIRNTIPISLFNRGLAGKIFEEVKQCGAKVVMKNNTAECVLLSPDEYIQLIDEVNDARLLTMAANRMAKADPSSFIPADQLYADMGITQADLDEILTTAVVLNMDSKLLCSEDCKGLCPKCGADLNLGPCGCKPETDPRLAVLQQFLNK